MIINPVGILKEWSSFLREVRNFFYRRGYLEVNTPVLLEFPNLDPNITPIPVTLHLKGSEKRMWLQTSPEYSMKKILAREPADIFQIARVFRDNEYGKVHRPEFTMLEWYRIGGDYRDLIEEVRELVKVTCGLEISEELTFHRAVEEYLGFSYTEDPEILVRKLEEKGMFPSGSWDIETLTDFILSQITVRLKDKVGIFITDFPACASALARVRNGVAERFELFIRGVEIANGWTEERDPHELRKRLIKESSKRGLPLDEDFIRACSQMPPCSGCSVGLERLFMIRKGSEDLGDIELLP